MGTTKVTSAAKQALLNAMFRWQYVPMTFSFFRSDTNVAVSQSLSDYTLSVGLESSIPDPVLSSWSYSLALSAPASVLEAAHRNMTLELPGSDEAVYGYVIYEPLDTNNPLQDQALYWANHFDSIWNIKKGQTIGLQPVLLLGPAGSVLADEGLVYLAGNMLSAEELRFFVFLYTNDLTPTATSTYEDFDRNGNLQVNDFDYIVDGVFHRGKQDQKRLLAENWSSPTTDSDPTVTYPVLTWTNTGNRTTIYGYVVYALDQDQKVLWAERFNSPRQKTNGETLKLRLHFTLSSE